MDGNTAALLQEGSFLRLSAVTQFQGIQTMLARPFLLQKRQACVMWWQQRLPVLSEHVSMPLNSFNQVNVATYNVMQPLVLLAGIQDFFFLNLTRPSFMESYYQSIVALTCWNPENLILSCV